MSKRKNKHADGIVKDLIDKFLPTRKQFPPKVRKIIEKYGSNTIKHIDVGRTPVQKFVTKLLNYLSLGKFEEQAKDMNYDDVYHLFMIATLDNGINLLIEKNQVINMEVVSPEYISKAKDVINVPVHKSITLDEMMKNTLDKVGPSLFLYDHVNNNCQVFINNILSSNGLNNSQISNFIMQDIEKVLSKSPEYVNAIARFATEASAKIDRLKQGEGKKKIGGRRIPRKIKPKTNKKISKSRL